MKRFLWITVAVVCIAICIASGSFLLRYYIGLKRTEKLIQSVRIESVPSAPQQSEEPASAQPDPSAPEQEQSEEPTQKTVQIPFDFDAMHEINPDIYAWLVVPGTNIDCPILQSQTDDLFYNDHGIDAKPFILGAVYSQKTYNSRTFQDPMTFLYGHGTYAGQPADFDELNDFADELFFETHREILVYVHDEMYVYTIFAACNHGNEHILRYYDFSDETYFNLFFDEFYDESKSCDHLDLNAMPKFGDKLITLSTCYEPDKSQRYLVFGVLTDVYTAEH